MKSPLITYIKYINPSSETYGKHKSNHIQYIATNKDIDNPYTINGEEKKDDDKEDEEVYTFKKDRDHQVKYAEYMVKEDKEELESGLFTYYGEADLDKAVAELKNHKNTVYTAVISLREDDAKDLGYDDPEKWIDMAKKNVSRIMKDSFGFSYQNTKWYGAIHMKNGHPHMHLMFYEKERTKSYNKFKIEELDKFRREFASVMFSEKRTKLLYQKDEIQKRLKESIGKSIKEIASDGLLKEEKDVAKEIVKQVKINDSKLLGGKVNLSRRVKNGLSKIIMDNQEKISNDSNLRYGYATKQEKELTNEVMDFLLQNVLRQQKKELYEIKKELYSQYRTIDEEMEVLILREVNREIKENIRNQVFRNLKKISQHNPYKVNEEKFKRYVNGVNFISLQADLEFKEKIAVSKLLWNLEEKIGFDVEKEKLPSDLKSFYEKYKQDFELQKLLDRDIFLYETEREVLDKLDIGVNSDINFYEYYSSYNSRGVVDSILRDVAIENQKVANSKYRLLFSLNDEAKRKVLEKEIREKYSPQVAEMIIKKFLKKSAVDIALNTRNIKSR